MLKFAGVDIDSQVDFCISGQEALECVRLATQNNLAYKLILTDFNMPIMDGIEATRLIR